MILQRRHNSLRLSGLSLLGLPSMWSMSSVVLWLFRVVALVEGGSFRVVALIERGLFRVVALGGVGVVVIGTVGVAWHMAHCSPSLRTRYL